MKENTEHLQHIMLYHFKKGKTHLKHINKMCAVHGEGAVTDQMCQKWFVKFRAGDFSLDYASGLGRPVDPDSDQIETLTENSQCHTTQGRADTLKTSKSIKLLVKMKNVSFILQKISIWTFWPI